LLPPPWQFAQAVQAESSSLAPSTNSELHVQPHRSSWPTKWRWRGAMRPSTEREPINTAEARAAFRPAMHVWKVTRCRVFAARRAARGGRRFPRCAPASALLLVRGAGFPRAGFFASVRIRPCERAAFRVPEAFPDRPKFLAPARRRARQDFVAPPDVAPRVRRYRLGFAGRFPARESSPGCR